MVTLEELIADCLESMKAGQRDLWMEYGLGEIDRFEYDQETARLRLRSDAGKSENFPVAVVGSWSPSGKWLWAWANASLLPEARIISDKIKTAIHPLVKPLLAENSFPADEQTAWELAALSMRALGARTVLRILVKTDFVFMAILNDDRK